MTTSNPKPEDVAGVLSTYRDVWNDFYEWEQKYSTEVIKSLVHPGQNDCAQQKTKGKEKSLDNEESVDPDSLTLNWPNSRTLRRAYPTDRVTSIHAQPLIERPEIIIEAPRHEPSPIYEACVPIVRNTFTGDDPDNLTFFPFPVNDKKFNLADYLDQYASLAWQARDMGPDREH